jgi:threonine dehydratase
VISFILHTQTPQNERESEVNSVLAALKARDMHAEDISGNELAKSHVRYLVGGKVAVPDERLFSFGMVLFVQDLLVPSR